MCSPASPSLHPLCPIPSILVPYGWPEEDGLIVINVIKCDLERLHGLIGWLALVAGHDNQLGREEKAPSWAKPRGPGDMAEGMAGWWRILRGFNRELGVGPPG